MSRKISLRYSLEMCNRAESEYLIMVLILSIINKKLHCSRDCVASKDKWFFFLIVKKEVLSHLSDMHVLKWACFWSTSVIRNLYLDALSITHLTVLLLYNPIGQYSFTKLLSISLYYKQWIFLKALKLVRKTVNVFFAMKKLKWIFYRPTSYCIMFEP